jgi:phenylalanyl-tRNA synthetase beta chain
MPQSIFEIGDVVLDHNNVRLMSAVSIHPKASYTEVKSLIQSLLGALDVDFQLSSCDEPCYISGRSANIILKGEVIGNFGELHPQVIENFELGCPIAAMEISLQNLY